MRNQIMTAALLAALTGLMLLVGYLVGGNAGMAVGLIFGLAINFASYFWSHKIVLAMYRAKPADPKRHETFISTVREVAHLAGLPMPKAYVIPSDALNAFATGRNATHAVIAATDGLIATMDARELRGVIAHEMSHIKNRDMLISTIAAGVASVISYVAFMARWAAIFGGMGRDDRDGPNILELIVLAILAPLLAMLIQMAISRSREYMADETGARMVHDKDGLASALLKLEAASKKRPMRLGNEATSHLFIVNPFSGRMLATLFSTHPSTARRVEKLRALRF